MIDIGRIAGTYGYSGVVKVEPYGSFPQRFLELKRVYLKRPTGTEVFEVEKAFLQQGKIYIKFQGLDSKETVAQYNRAFIQVPEEEAYALPPGHYYHFQLQGLQVLDAEQRILGTLEEVLTTGANDVYLIRKADGRELLIPAIKQVIRKVDLAAGVMQVELPAGLEDLS